jgi:hypothetical protein
VVQLPRAAVKKLWWTFILFRVKKRKVKQHYLMLPPCCCKAWFPMHISYYNSHNKYKNKIMTIFYFKIVYSHFCPSSLNVLPEIRNLEQCIY